MERAIDGDGDDDDGAGKQASSGLIRQYEAL
jgi:hypothetical protein